MVKNLLLIFVILTSCICFAEQDSIQIKNLIGEWKNKSVDKDSEIYKKLLLNTVLDYEYYTNPYNKVSIVRTFSKFKLVGASSNQKYCTSNAEDSLILSIDSYPESVIVNKAQVTLVAIASDVDTCQQQYLGGKYIRVFGASNLKFSEQLVNNFELEKISKLCSIKNQQLTDFNLYKNPAQVLVDESSYKKELYKGNLYIFTGLKNYLIRFSSAQSNFMGLGDGDLAFDSCVEN